MLKYYFCFVFVVLFSGCNGNTDAPPNPDAQVAYVAPSRDPGLLTATQTFGALYVSDGEIFAESPKKPWSSWWFPKNDTYLFQATRSGPSPLEKYDSYMKKVRSQPKSSAAYEKEHLFLPDAAGWEGLCDAWALASLMEPEPTRPIRVGDTTFGIGDLKALLIKTYEKPKGLIKFGQRFDGNSNSIYEDIYPDQFHAFLQEELFKNKSAFIMDKDAGIPVWNTPIWKSFIRIKSDPNPHIKHVDTWLVGADPHVDDLDFVGTREVNFEYTYDLYGNTQPDGRFQALYGKWTGLSIEDHPDFLTALSPSITAESFNKEIDKEEVKKLLAR